MLVSKFKTILYSLLILFTSQILAVVMIALLCKLYSFQFAYAISYT